MYNIGDRIKIVATKAEADKPYIGLIGSVAQIYNGQKDVCINQKMVTLHKSTIVEPVKDDNIVLNLSHQDGDAHISYSMDNEGNIVASLFLQDEFGEYKKIKQVNVNTLVWKHIEQQRWLEDGV